MGSIVLISKLRPHFMGKVVTAMEKLNAILPPTLERSQVTSVRKHMKVQLIGLLRHSRGVDYYDSITTLLTDLGATHQELYKAVPNFDEIRAEKRKRQRANAEKEESSSRKRPRLVEEQAIAPLEDEEEEEDYDDDEDNDKAPAEASKSEPSVLNETEKMIFDKLTPEMAAEIVLVSMEKLPDTLPAHFMASYTPIAIAGTENQIRHVSRLLAAQITASQLGPAAALQGFPDPSENLENAEPVQIRTLLSMPLGIAAPVPEPKLTMPIGTKKKFQNPLN